ncbi:MAG: phospholipid carrier-dependent glycosyltransferase, partial [Chloroflexi bacterium]
MTSPAVTNPPLSAARFRKRAWIYDLLFLTVLLAGLYLRLNGSNWGEYQYLHPDERFLIWVGTDISPVDSLAEYFDTQNSSLNPHNRGHGYYVYGTLPMFLTRYLVQEVYGHSGFNEMTDIGRLLSTVMDMLTVFVMYLIGSRLYDRRAGLLGAAFTTFAVLHIQQSHFFTADTFIVFFTVLALYFAILIIGVRSRQVKDSDQGLGTGDREVSGSTTAVQATIKPLVVDFFAHPLFLLSIAFGAALGCAVSSKINAFPVAAALPVAMVIRYFSLPREDRERDFLPSVLYLFIAAFTSLLVFRIAQPYAFAGPGFFNISLNPAWLDDMRELRAGASGDIDYPFALQWARRSITFSGKNMILYGMGIPMGLTAFAGFFWAGWRMLKARCEWRKHLLPWLWVAAYFTWQSLQFNPTMRYQLPVYPILALFAGWFLVALFDKGRHGDRYTGKQVDTRESDRGLGTGEWEEAGRLRGGGFQIIAVLLGLLSLGLTAAWAFAFTHIYSAPITRNEASRLIFQNIPGPINLHIETEDGLINQPVHYPGAYTIQGSAPYFDTFTAQADGYITKFNIGFIQDQSSNAGITSLRASIGQPGISEPLAFIETDIALSLDDNPSRTLEMRFQDLPVVHAGGDYTITIEVLSEGKAVFIEGPLSILIESIDTSINQQLPYPSRIIRFNEPYNIGITRNPSGILREILLSNVVEETYSPEIDRLSVELVDQIHGNVLGSALLETELSGEPQDFLLQLDNPVELTDDGPYAIRIRLESETGQVRLQGEGIANESDFDDALPVRIDGYDGFAGFYPRGVVFQAYWGENPEKLARYVNVMDQAEYIVITSSRQWGSIPRVPERYPMAAIYYRELIGCPAVKEVEWCYNVAKEGTFEGRLGYELVKVFQSDPGIGPVKINDQPSEEAFTVYDHPKVFIFKKTSAFDADEVRGVLGAVDFSQVMHLTPKKVPDNPANLMLPSHLFAKQQEGGTWSELFSYDALQNRYPVLGLVLWYVFIFVLGLAAYPFVRLALPGLQDRGYPLARITGLILLAYLAWISGSAGAPVTRGFVAAFFLCIAVVGALLAYLQRNELKEELRHKRGYFLTIEALFLAFFVFDLLIRLGNPDLWHPWKGGERPMDFSYFNAIIKST